MPRILVTGGCGYLGSQLIRDLALVREDGFVIRILDNLQRNTVPALFDLPDAATYEFFEGDVLDARLHSRVLEDVDVVVHLAAIVRTPMAFDHPTWVEQVNHWGTAHLVRSAVQRNVRHFVYASTTAVYGPGGPFDETAPVRPIGPYATSKAAAEAEILDQCSATGTVTTVLRLGMLFGDAPSVRFDGMVNRLALLGGLDRTMPIHGSGMQRRPVVHVRDASAAIAFAVRERLSGTYNVVGQNPTVRDVVAAVQASCHGARAKFTEQDVLNHLSFEVDASALAERGFVPRHEIATGVAELIARLRGVRTPGVRTEA